MIVIATPSEIGLCVPAVLLDSKHRTSFPELFEPVQLLYSDSLPPYDALLSVWRFLQRILGLSRGIGSQEFWMEVGRLPVPVASTQFAIAPAFLTYWPAGHDKAGGSLAGVSGLRRLSERFLSDLPNGTAVPSSAWEAILENAGVTGTPKVLTFVRSVGAGRETSFSTSLVLPERHEVHWRAAARSECRRARRRPVRAVWDEFVARAPFSSKEPRTLQQLTVVEALERSCALAHDESEVNHEGPWKVRLWSLIHSLPGHADLPGDLVFKRVSTGGGFNEPCGFFFDGSWKWSDGSLPRLDRRHRANAFSGFEIVALFLVARALKRLAIFSSHMSSLTT